MKTKTIGLLMALLACVPILAFHARDHHLLLDTDTAFLISKLNEYRNPLRWFSHDWPLENHFYRPVSTLFFEYDNHFHPGNNSAFGFTNAAIMALATMALYWFLCEVRRSIPFAVAGTWLFAIWTSGAWFLGSVLDFVVPWVPWIFFILIVGRIIANRKFNLNSLMIGAGGFFVWNAFDNTAASLREHTYNWLPGRTATSMTIFVLLALAAYVRFERLGAANRALPEPSPLDPPATRSSTQDEEPRGAWGWYLLSLVCTALALASYEQAVMVPALIFILGVWLRTCGKQTRFSLQIFFWAVLVAYLVYRVQIIPVKPSGYQKQQFRDGPGLWIDIFNYIFPGLFGLWAAVNSFSSGVMILLTDSVWGPVGAFVCNIGAWYSVRKRWLRPAIALALALFSYLPMAFLKQFGHYHYLPAAMMSLFVLTLLEVYWPMLMGAIGPTALQAPARAERAPGSLPRV